jgi:aryl-alcohol dehydrogenase-like predicted oxidoreductase
MQACGLGARKPKCSPTSLAFSVRDPSMQIRNLGGSGLRVSAVGLGCNNFGQRCDLETSRKVIHKAIDLGITLFDTADIYAGLGGSETVLGAVLGDRRKNIVLATPGATSCPRSKRA